MKILGKAGGEYIAQISHAEIEKILDKYYGKMPSLEVGAEANLADGYNFRDDIQRACRQMADSMKAFEAARNTLLRFANMVNSIEKTEGVAS